MVEIMDFDLIIFITINLCFMSFMVILAVKIPDLVVNISESVTHRNTLAC